MDTIQEYLSAYVTEIPHYSVTKEDEKIITFEGIETFIFRKLSRSTFKASSMPDEFEAQVKEKIQKSVAAKKPIHVTVPFGGYKKWQLPTAPLPDWAEVFNIVLLREYLAPIAAAYEHGVMLQYVSDEIFISRMNNYPQEDVDAYNDQFEQLIQFFQEYLPRNFGLTFSKIRDEISQEEILKRFDDTILRLRKEWAELSDETREYRIQKAERNYRGDLSILSNEEKYEVLLDSTMIHDAFIEGEWEQGVTWAFGEFMIPVGFRYTGSWGIHLRSSRSSTVQFWIGVGALQQKPEGYLPTILTYNQYQTVERQLKEEQVEVFSEKFPNLRSILVLPHR